MTTKTLGLSLIASLGLALGLAACQSTQPGPVQPLSGSKAPGVLLVDPSLQAWLDVPNGEQNYSFTSNGFLQYSSIVRNRGSQPMNLSYTADFFDGQGVPVESKSPVVFFIDPQSQQPIHVVANHRDAKSMTIQIRPAK